MFVADTCRGRVSGGFGRLSLKDIRFVVVGVGACRVVLSGSLSGEGAMVNPIR